MENTEHGDFSPSSNKPVKDLLSLAIAQEKNIEEEDEKVQPPINIEEESDHVQPPINFEEEAAVEPRQEEGQWHANVLKPGILSSAMAGASRHGGFPNSPALKDEISIPLSDLANGIVTPGTDYDLSSGLGKVMAHAAQYPESLAPVEVINIEGKWLVLDGRARVQALIYQHGITDNVMVRAVRWHGSMDDYIYRQFSQEYLSLTKRKIDKPCLLARFQSKWGVSQTSLAAKVGKKESQVSKDLKAAAAYLEAPRFTYILERSDDPSVDYCYQIQCGREAALQADIEQQKAGLEGTAMAELNHRLEELIEKGARFSANDALVALGLKEPKVEDGEPSPEAMEAGDQWICTDFVAGSDDQPAINILLNPQNLLRFDFLVVPSELPAPEKEELKLRLLEHLAKIFG